MTVEEQKKFLRNKFIAARKDLSTNEVFSKSRFIFSKLINTELYRKAVTIHCYVSISRQNEVETRNVIQHMLAHGKTVVVPKIEKETLLTHYEIDDLGALTENRWGVAEPDANNKTPVAADELDLVIVPMVSGDKKKNRLGYGKGFYDRFLSGVSAPKTGVLFDVQLYDHILPTDRYDVQLDMLITETKILE